MNQLKHILGKNVPRRVPSHAASSSMQHRGQRADVYLKSHRLSHQLLRSDLLPATKTNHSVGVRYSGRFRQGGVQSGSRTICRERSKLKSSMIPLRKSSVNKRLSTHNIARAVRRYSTCQNVEFNDGETSERHMSRDVAMTDTESVSRNCSFVAPVKKRSRSYAEIIADYSEALYKEAVARARNRGPQFDNKARKSLFGPASAPPMGRTIFNVGDNSDDPTVAQKNRSSIPADVSKPSERRIQRENSSDIEHHVSHDVHNIETASKSNDQEAGSDLRYENQSYVADCTKSVRDVSLADDDRAVRRNILTGDRLEPLTTATKESSSVNAQEAMSRKAHPAIGAVLVERSVEKKTTDKISEKRKTDLSLQKHNYSQLSNESSNLRYLGSATRILNLPVRENSMLIPTVSALRQPQVELRMVPSEQESVVSINVDSTSGESMDPLRPAAKQLSIVVQSDQRKSQSIDQRNVAMLRRGSASAQSWRNDIGPMRVSICEDSVPVKQIEFSINGKPVSELKSITARAERLDVVSSVEKIEIRIPYDKDNARSKIGGEGDLPRRADLRAEQILQVQISANILNPAKGGAERPYKTDTRNATPSSSPQLPKPHYAFDDSAKISETILGSDTRQYGFSDQVNAKSDGTAESGISKRKTSDDVEIQQRREVAMKLSSDEVATGVPSIEKTHRAEVEKVSVKRITNTVRIPKVRKYEKGEASDSRFPSKVVPWWSSSDCFKEIRREDDHKLSASTSNLNKEKVNSNSKQNLVEFFLHSKPKETPSSSKTPRKTQSINKATPDKNNSSVSFRPNFLEQRQESKPTIQYSSLFRLKPKRENIISEIARDDSKAKNEQVSATEKNEKKISKSDSKFENRQTTVMENSEKKVGRSDSKIENKRMSAAEKSEKKISEVERAKPTTLRVTGKANIRSEYDQASIEFDTRVRRPSASPRKYKAPSSAQNLKRNQDKKHDYPLKQAKSIDDVQISMKSNIENVLHTMRPIEKKKDGTLIDYGLKVPSRKPIAGRNNDVKIIPHPFSAITKVKNLVPEKSTEMKTEQIDKILSAKPAESDKTKKIKRKINILNKNENQILKNSTTNIKTQYKNNLKSAEQARKSETLKSSTLRNSPKLTEMEKKREKLASDVVDLQDRKKSLKASSGIREKSKELGTSIRIPPEKVKQSGQEISKSASQTKILESKNLRNSESSKKELKDNQNFPKESENKKLLDRRSLEATSKMHVKSTDANKSSSSHIKQEIKNHLALKNSTDKNAGGAPTAHKSADELDKNVKKKVAVTSESPSSKDCKKDREKNRESKSGKDGGGPSGSAGGSNIPSSSIGFKPSDSKTRAKSAEKTSDKYNYVEKLSLVESSRVSLDGKEDALPSSPLIVFKTRDSCNIDDISKNRALGVTPGGTGLCTNMDRPVKSVLYSAWLRRFKNDFNNNEESF